MARKRVDLMAAGRPEGREHVWCAIRVLREFTILDLEEATRICEATIRTYVNGLTKAGYLERIEGERRDKDTHGRYVRNRWRLARDVGVEAPRVTREGQPVTQGQPREQMWRTMRILGEFSVQDLVVNAATETCPIQPIDAHDYCRYLRLAGYLHIAHKGTGGRVTRYRFLQSRWTGPRPPQVQRIRQVWDPNLGQVVWTRGGAA